ncbi:MAG TPA: DUF433 domain-containing protein [Blastocatellia bacterium]|nr:DUF433 domain-containing protein [Blastocatellia bacterium]
MSEVITERITRTPGVCGGKACIAGHRVRVMDIVIWHDLMGMSADEIVDQIPTISLSDVHAALAYYFDHVEEIRDEMRREESFVDEFMKKNPSALEAKLKRLRGEDAG